MGAASHVCDGGQVTDGHRHLWHTCAGRALLLTEPLEDTLFFLFLNWGTLKKKFPFLTQWSLLLIGRLLCQDVLLWKLIQEARVAPGFGPGAGAQALGFPPDWG